MTTLSLCMIVKNEQKSLDRILSIASTFCDEIIIVDTGSTDNTKNIAKRYTKNVYDFTWVNDFSKARNFALDKATKDYILWLDADDYIDFSNVEKIKKLLKTDLYADIYMFLYDCGKDETGASNLIFYRERLLKTSKKFRFVGAVHEAINLSGRVEYLDILIEHKKQVKTEPKRNLKIYFNMQKSGVKFTPRDTYYFGRELYYNNYFTRAKTQFKRFIKMDGFIGDLAEAHILLTDCYIKTNNLNLAKKVIFDALKKYRPYPELLYKVGEVMFLLKQYEMAIAYFNFATTTPLVSYNFERPLYKNLYPYLMLTVIYFNLGDFKSAKFYHEKCKMLSPKHPSVIHNDKLPQLK